MGLRAPSFELQVPTGQLAQNAGLVTAFFDVAKVVVTSAGREIPTTTVWTGTMSDAPQSTSYAMLRPGSGDWPLGPLRVVAYAWQDQVLAQCEVIVAAAIDGTPPTCTYVSGRMTIHTMAAPDGGGRPPMPGIVITGVVDACGPIVSIAVEHTNHGSPDVSTHHAIASATGGGASIVLGDSFDAVTRIRITNAIGKTLELLPPFPRGTPPAGPLGVTF